MISFDNISKSYNKGNIVLKNINFKIEEGQFIFIKGVSGSGKTTLLNLISTLDRPDTGQISIDGSDVLSLSQKQLSIFRNQSMGMIFQKYNLFPYLSSIDNVIFPKMYNTNIHRKEIRELALNQLDALGIKDIADRSASNLSGGEQQRVCIARVLFQDTKILLADEPTANVDSASQDIIIRSFVDFKNKGKTVVVVSHNPIYKKYADMIFSLEKGEITFE